MEFENGFPKIIAKCTIIEIGHEEKTYPVIHDVVGFGLSYCYNSGGIVNGLFVMYKNEVSFYSFKKYTIKFI